MLTYSAYCGIATIISSPQSITDNNTALLWEISEGTLLSSLQALHEELYRRRESIDPQNVSPFGDDLDLMALLCHAPELTVRAGPSLSARGSRLSMEPCRIVTSPPVTGLLISIGVYGEYFRQKVSAAMYLTTW